MKNEDSYFELIKGHYAKIWHSNPKIFLWDKGPFERLHYDFKVLEFPPSSQNKMWKYATCCMSAIDDEYPIELHLFSNKKDDSIIELLTAVAYYHKNSAKLNLWHTVNFGGPWQGDSLCDHGYISLPYIDGQDLETLHIDRNNDKTVRFYWLIPITGQEMVYKKEFGADVLEQLFEKHALNYTDTDRKSLVGK